MPIRRMRRVRPLLSTQPPPPPFTNKQLRDFEAEMGKLVQKLLKEKALDGG